MLLILGIVLDLLRLPGYWLWRRRQTFRVEGTGPNGIAYSRGGFRLWVSTETYLSGIHHYIWLNDAELSRSYENASGSEAGSCPSLELVRQHLTEDLLRQGFRKVYIQEWTPDWGS